jgi:hypothetical protein
VEGSAYWGHSLKRYTLSLLLPVTLSSSFPHRISCFNRITGSSHLHPAAGLLFMLFIIVEYFCAVKTAGNEN